MRVNLDRALIPGRDTQSQLDYLVSDMRRRVAKNFERQGAMLQMFGWFAICDYDVNIDFLQRRDKVLSELFDNMVYEAHVEELELENGSVETPQPTRYL